MSQIFKKYGKEICHMYCDKKLCMREIGNYFNISRRTVEKVLKQMDVPIRNQSEAKKLAGWNSGQYQKGKNNPNWKGGRNLDSDGYIRLLKPKHPRANGGYVFEHIVIWEKAHNKKLPKGWVIHHLNGIKDDNRIENLLALSDQKHKFVIKAFQSRICELEKQLILIKKECDKK